MIEFEKYFDTTFEFLYHAPGRVNLIGEHTDYNGGYVFPCALSFGTYAALAPRDDSTASFASTSFTARASIDLSRRLEFNKAYDWINYPLGVVSEFERLGFSGRGFDILFRGNIPNGAGLSSSASVELAMAVALNDIYDAGIPMMRLVELCQRAENVFVGMNCGIMDQFAVGMGLKNKAMLLNCRSLEYSYVPLELGGCGLVISNTNKRRGLVDSKYNERRAECERAVKMLKKGIDIELLGELDAATFGEHKHLLDDPVVLKRAEHIVSEDDRTLRAVDRLKAGDLTGFGQLLNESHDSLRMLYEVTGAELDALVEEARRIPGVYGSRMTGGGFGGCTVSLVQNEAIDRFIAEVGKNYTARTGLKADFYVAETGDGAKRIN